MASDAGGAFAGGAFSGRSLYIVENSLDDELERDRWTVDFLVAYGSYIAFCPSSVASVILFEFVLKHRSARPGMMREVCLRVRMVARVRSALRLQPARVLLPDRRLT